MEILGGGSIGVLDQYALENIITNHYSKSQQELPLSPIEKSQQKKGHTQTDNTHPCQIKVPGSFDIKSSQLSFIQSVWKQNL